MLPFAVSEQPQHSFADLRQHAVHRWAKDPAPKRRFLVDHLVLAGKHQMLASDGGIGKTNLLLDLGLKLAAFQPESDQRWLGQKILEGGTVVIITNEDDSDEIHARLSALDPTGRLRKEAGDRLIILCMLNYGGAFAFVEKHRLNGSVKVSVRWGDLRTQLRNLSGLCLVCLDTMNSALHGPENDSVVINEFIQVTAPFLCGQLGAAFLVTHHVRKPCRDLQVRNAADMRSAIRGSSALIGAFRSVIGIWPTPNEERRLKAMGHDPKPGQLFSMAVVKANNPEMLNGERLLSRSPAGLLEPCENPTPAVDTDEKEAWLLLAIELAAKAGHPYTNESKTAKNGLYARKHELPPALRGLGYGQLGKALEGLLEKKLVVACAAKGSMVKKYLDVPGGQLASDQAGASLNKGAYEIPDWSEHRWDPVEGRIKTKSEGK